MDSAVGEKRVSGAREAAGPLYLDTAEATARLLGSIRGANEIAVDTEGASFHRFVDRIYLLQLSTRETTAIVDPLPLEPGALAGLGALLEDAAVEVVFHDADYDLRLLYQDYGWRVTHIFDTRVAAQLLGLRAFGLAALLERYLGVRLEKKFQRADWSLRPLTPGMLEYAVQDTMHLLELRDRMRAELERAGRWEWAAEEFARLEGTRWEPEATDGEDTGYQRIKGARDLTRRELALFRELVRWRDEVARSLDRATFRVVGNEALLAAAREAPRTAEALRGIKGMPRALVERRGEEILGAVRRGLEVSGDALPRFPRPPRWARDPDFDARVKRLREARDAAARRLDLDPGVLCSRERLERIARERPRSLEELAALDELRRWQLAELGPALVEAMRALESSAAVAAPAVAEEPTSGAVPPVTAPDTP